MREILQFAILGLGIGGIYVLAAQGIVLVFRASKVLNFAHGAIALVGGITYLQATRAGLPQIAALLVGIVVCAVLGVLIQALVMRPLRHAAPLTKLVATLSILVIIRSAAALHYGDRTYFAKSWLPSRQLTIAVGIHVTEDRLWLLGIAAVITAGLWWVYGRTSFGLTASAVAENQRAAAALGKSPGKVAMINWAAGSALAGLAGILVIPIIGLSVAGLTELVFAAMAAALVGSFTSFPLTMVGGLVIGVAEAETTRYVSTPGWSTAVPFIVIIAVLLARGNRLPLRSQIVEKLPVLGNGRINPIMLVVVCAAGFGLTATVSGNLLDAMTTSIIGAVMGLSLVVVTGYTGQLSLAQYALAGAGAFIASRLAASAQLPFWAALPVGVLATIPIGLVFAWPALRARGVSVAISTLGLALVVQTVWLGNPNFTGGFNGIVVPAPKLFGLDIDTVTYPDRYAALCMLCFAAAGVAVANLRRGRAGRRLVAVRTNERAAETLGISVFESKFYGFGLAAAIAALGGILQAFRTSNVIFDQFNLDASVNLVILMVVAGIGFAHGSVFAGMAVTGGVVSFWLSQANADRYLPLIFGFFGLINVIATPSGVAHENIVIYDRVKRRFLRTHGRRPATEPAIGRTKPATERVSPQRLVAENIRVQVGGTVALDGVSLTLEPGKVLGLIGPNGAGKTTLIDVITGLTRAYTGSVTLDGESIDDWSAVKRARRGLGRSLQSLELFEDLTVRDNLRAACDRRDVGAYLTDLVWPRTQPLSAAAMAAVREFSLDADLDRRPSELPYGRRRLVAIARAMAAQPSVLLLDEPGAGLDEAERAELGDIVRRLATEFGVAVLLVEHDVNLVMRICDPIVVLDFGQPIATGAPEQVRNDPAVITAFLGTPESGNHDDPVECVTVPSGGEQR